MSEKTNKKSINFEFPEIRTNFDAVSKRFEEGELAAKLASIFDSEEVKAKMTELEEFATDVSEDLHCNKEDLLERCAVKQNVMNNALYEALIQLSTNPACWNLKELMLESMSVEKTILIIEDIIHEMMSSIIGKVVADEFMCMLESIFCDNGDDDK
ncbi:MAG: hypothetical protein ACI4VN_04330 [Clostridia bacterium]